ncbi:hypothetical protein BD410DRAFT_203972 [Rickenella mellea]|uniref:RING-type domain-containing protein n=1 Tax=Rickenella mellea TaxID=50990 RepID=A0A4Y7PG64_9AGAM|nr:hypothetical protein BD410DRAFT_203972 [Rickenella mellea]
MGRSFSNDVIVLYDSDDEIALSRKRAKIVGPRPRAAQADIQPGSSRHPAGATKVNDAPLQRVAPAAASQEAKPRANTSKVFLDSTNVQDPQIDAAGLIPAEPPASKDPVDGFVATILEFVPDVDPCHARALVEKHKVAYGDEVVETVLHILLEDASYPKLVKNKLKRKLSSNALDVPEQSPAKKAQIDYGISQRQYNGGQHYVELAMNQLFMDFPYIPKPHVRAVFFRLNHLYAPTHLRLKEEQKQPTRPYKHKASPTRVSGKGKGHDEEFERERKWLLARVNGQASDSQLAEGSQTQLEESDDGIECGCCFTAYPFDKMVQCPDAHLFCMECMNSYVSNLLGQHDPNIRCMDQSGCKLLFSESELSRFLTSKLLALYHRVKQNKEVEAAGLDGLEECPFCEYKVVIDNPDEKLFRCENEECGAVTCRACKKADHLPKSCKEVEEDKTLDARHTVEEAMTKALMRNCPKCQKPFIKEMGCNKMTCPNCRTVSCYICRKIINGYDHFQTVRIPIPAKQFIYHNSAPLQTPVQNQGKCVLWDPVEQRHDQEVAAARQRAMEEYRREHPDINEKDLAVELPKAAVQPAAHMMPGMAAFGGPALNAHVHAHMMPLPPHMGMPGMPAPGIHYQVNLNLNGHPMMAFGHPQAAAAAAVLAQQRALALQQAQVAQARVAQLQAAREQRTRQARIQATQRVVPATRAAAPVRRNPRRKR